MKGTTATERRSAPEQAVARSTVYRLLADLSLYPDSAAGPTEQRPDAIDRRRSELEDACTILAEADYDSRTLRLLTELAETFFATSHSELASEYVRVFGHTISKECPPYEAQYGVPHLFEQTAALADLAGFYRAFGLQPSAAAGERLDHLGIELEFMYVLTYKEAYALEHHGAGQADLCHAAQERFLCDHLGTWVDDFAARMSQRTKRGAYKLYADALRCYVGAELSYLAVSPVKRKQLKWQPQLAESLSCTVSCGSGSDVPCNPEAG